MIDSPIIPMRMPHFPVLIFLLMMNTGPGFSQDNQLQKAEEIIRRIKEKWAPDPRTEVFDVSVKRETKVIVYGETSSPVAMKNLMDSLKSAGINPENRIQYLPGAELQATNYGVIRIPVANIRRTPSHAAELVTQLLLGLPVRILKQKDDWYFIQGPDRYLGWVDEGGIELFNSSRFEAYRLSKKIIYLKKSGELMSFSENRQAVVSDLTAGNILEVANEPGNFYEVVLPDGRRGMVKKEEVSVYHELFEQKTIDQWALLNTAQSLTGVSYLWGGTSARGMDCSGFTRMVYLMHGLLLPRDADQQAMRGLPADEKGDFGSLQPGDLLFFGRKFGTGTEKITHVGIWLGGMNFIHSSGRVKVNSMDPSSPLYDDFNRKRYIRARRYITESIEPDMAMLKLFEIF